jgi:hypothetical protein
MMRAGVYVMVACTLLATMGWCVQHVRRAQARESTNRHIKSQLNALLALRPDSILHQDWSFLIGWTINAHANTVAADQSVNIHQLASFASELDSRIAQRQLDIALFDWIWDQFISLTPTAQEYSDRFRPTRQLNAAAPAPDLVCSWCRVTATSSSDKPQWGGQSSSQLAGSSGTKYLLRRKVSTDMFRSFCGFMDKVRAGRF